MATTRHKNGKFTNGNRFRFRRGGPGGPGRPARKIDIEAGFLEAVTALVRSPARFGARQRQALKDLLLAIAEGANVRHALAAAQILISLVDAEATP